MLLVNYGAVYYCVFAGPGFGDVSFLFQERQAITFLSSLQLALISFVSMMTFIIGRIIYRDNKRPLKDINVWFASSIVFGFCVIDEYFMVHEGIDGGLATIFFGITKNLHLDGITLFIYLIGALIIFLKFKDEILRDKRAFLLFCVGAGLFLLSILLDIKSTDAFQIILEETAKLFAVTFMLLAHVSVFIGYVDKLDKIVNRR